MEVREVIKKLSTLEQDKEICFTWEGQYKDIGDIYLNKDGIYEVDVELECFKIDGDMYWCGNSLDSTLVAKAAAQIFRDELAFIKTLPVEDNDLESKE